MPGCRKSNRNPYCCSGRGGEGHRLLYTCSSGAFQAPLPYRRGTWGDTARKGQGRTSGRPARPLPPPSPGSGPTLSAGPGALAAAAEAQGSPWPGPRRCDSRATLPSTWTPVPTTGDQGNSPKDPCQQPRQRASPVTRQAHATPPPRGTPLPGDRAPDTRQQDRGEAPERAQTWRCQLRAAGVPALPCAPSGTWGGLPSGAELPASRAVGVRAPAKC